VANICRRLEHQRATAVNHTDAVVSPPGCRCGGNAAGSEGVVHPNLSDAEVGALTYRGQRVLRASSHHYCLNATGNRLQVMKAPIAFDLVGVRVDRENLVSKLTQATVYGIGGVGLGFPRNARDRDTLLGEKFTGGFFDGHALPLDGASGFLGSHSNAERTTSEYLGRRLFCKRATVFWRDSPCVFSVLEDLIFGTLSAHMGCLPHQVERRHPISHLTHLNRKSLFGVPVAFTIRGRCV
jgi:hypothetical protein